MQSIQLAQLQENLQDSLTQLNSDSFTRFLNCSCRIVGIVKWYDRTKKYGFIKSMVDGEELFVHYKDLAVGSTRCDAYLVSGEYVEYEKVCIEDASKHKSKAISVRGVCGGPLMCESSPCNVPNFTPIDYDASNGL
jgi:cold shock CspA family protein